MPVPSSVTRTRLRPPAWISTVIRVAPASREFSTSSLTTLAGRSTTSPAAIWFATCSGKRRMRFTIELRIKKEELRRKKSRHARSDAPYLIGLNRKCEGKHRATLRRVRDGHLSVMVFDCFFRNGQAEAGAIGFAERDERFENLISDLRRNAFASVLHFGH